MILQLGLYSRLDPTQPGQDKRRLTGEDLQIKTYNSILQFHLTFSDTAVEDKSVVMVGSVVLLQQWLFAALKLPAYS